MQVGIALGSNTGDRLAHLQAGRELLVRLHGGARPAAVSPVYGTDPVDCPPGSDAFLNAVVEIETTHPPEELLRTFATLESQRGRPAARASNAPRPLDLDILYAGETVRQTAALTLPHPRLHLRRFVLQPLCDIRPHLQLPGFDRPVSALLDALPEEPAVRLFAAEW